MAYAGEVFVFPSVFSWLALIWVSRLPAHALVPSVRSADYPRQFYLSLCTVASFIKSDQSCNGAYPGGTR